MARLWQDGFEFNSTTATVSGYDTMTNIVIQTTHVRTGTYALKSGSPTSGTPQGANKKFQTATASCNFFQAGLLVVNVPSAANTIMALTGSSTLGASVRCSIALLNNGTLILQNASNAQIGSASAAVNDGNYHVLELKCDTTPSSGSRVIEARLDGVVFATSSAQTVGTVADIYVGSNGLSEAQTTGIWWFDDLIVNDNTGSAENSYPNGQQVWQGYPNAQGDANAFLVQVGGTAGSANNWTRVDEVPPNDATSYNASAVVNAQDLFKADVSGVPTNATVNCVMVGFRFANITGASATTSIVAQIEKTSGGTVANGSTIIPDSTTWATNGTASPRNYSLILYKDPDGVAWNPATWAPQIGYEILATLTDAIGVTNIWISVSYQPAVVSTIHLLSSTGVGQ